MNKKTVLSLSSKAILLFLGLIFLVDPFNGSDVHADIAPPKPPVGSDISPGTENTNVKMVSEYVVLDIKSSSIYPAGQANVTAMFLMHNTGDEGEYMRVRFPMHHIPFFLEEPELADSCGFWPGPSVNDLKVWINGDSVAVDVNYETMIDPIASNRAQEDVYITFPCWGHFNVHFPPKQNVNIKVSYKTSGYDYGGGDVKFMYVLGTGAGWKDTIGSADIVARLPYEVNNLNFRGCQPDDCEISGREIRWHYDDFEPAGLVELTTIKPSIWQRVLSETIRVENNSNDGEAWGRLGKAYKESLISGKGMIGLYDLRDYELFDLSLKAYTKAVELLPDDADWEYGFADLLCTRAMWDERTFENFKVCAEHLKKCIDINPEHEKGNELFEEIVFHQEIGWIEFDVVDTDNEYVFLILTPSAYHSATDILPTETIVIETITPTQESEGIFTSTPTTKSQLTTENAVKPKDVKPDISDGISKAIPLTVGGLLIIIVVGIIIKRQKEI